jgi:hypothetical protein
MYQKMYRFIENQRQKSIQKCSSPIEVKSIVYFCLHLTICEDHLRKQRLFRVLLQYGEGGCTCRRGLYERANQS